MAREVRAARGREQPAVTARARQIREALKTRERQVERAVRVDELLADGHILRTHHGYGLNVKDHDSRSLLWKTETRIGEADLPSTANGHGRAGAVYEMWRETFWRDAGELAGEHGFRGVHSAGRQSGYCLVDPQPATDDMYEEDLDEFLRTRLGPWACDVQDLIFTLRLELERELRALEPEPATSDCS